jgi:hypothetical protein
MRRGTAPVIRGGAQRLGRDLVEQLACHALELDPIALVGDRGGRLW